MGLTPCGDDPLVPTGLREFCLTHRTEDCFAVVNYRQRNPEQQRESILTPRKPFPTKSTYSMLITRIPGNITIYTDDTDVKHKDTPGLMRLLFALDHYGKKCDSIAKVYCQEVWEQIDEDDMDTTIKDLLPYSVPNFYDCLRVHRAFQKLWDKFDHSSKQCYLKDCICSPRDGSDSEDN